MVRSVEPLLGTRAEVVWTSSTASEQVEVAVLAEIARLEAIFTVFDEDSELHRYRRTGSTDVPELNAVLDLANHWHSRSRGAFNPTVRHLMAAWDRSEPTGRRPAPAELAELIESSDSSRSDDLNAIAKGWIADRALERCADDDGWGWLNLGGDVVARGARSLRVGIEDPDRPYDNVAPIASVEIRDEALATSGGARRHWIIDGRRYPKVLDPRTGEPVDHVASASVIASTAAAADVLATIGLVMAVDEFFDLVTVEGAHALVLLGDGTIRATSDRFVITPSQAR